MMKSKINIYGDLSVSLKTNHKWVKQILSQLGHASKELIESLQLTHSTPGKLSVTIKTRQRIKTRGQNDYSFEVSLDKKYSLHGATMRRLRKQLIKLPYRPSRKLRSMYFDVGSEVPKTIRGLYNIPEEIGTLNKYLNSKNHFTTLPKQIWQNALSIDNDGYLNLFQRTREMMYGYVVRSTYVQHYAWSIITTELITALCEVIGSDKACDLGSGTAYLSTLLQDKKVDVTAYDNLNGGYLHHKHNNTVVIDRDYTKVDVSPYKYVILSWPNYNESVASDLLDNLTENQILLYCGEGNGGCNANDEFFKKLKMQFEEIEELSEKLDSTSLCFSGIHDHWVAYRRVRSKDNILFKGKKYIITGRKLNLVYVQALDDNFKPIDYWRGSYDKAVLLKGLWADRKG